MVAVSVSLSPANISSVFLFNVTPVTNLFVTTTLQDAVKPPSTVVAVITEYPLFHAEQKRKYTNNAFLPQNLFYNPEKDFFVCPMGQRMEKIGNSTRKSESGFISKTSIGSVLNSLTFIIFAEKNDETLSPNSLSLLQSG